MRNEKVDIVVIGNIVRETIFMTDKPLCLHKSCSGKGREGSGNCYLLRGRDAEGHYKRAKACGYDRMYSVSVYNGEPPDLPGGGTKQGRIFQSGAGYSL